MVPGPEGVAPALLEAAPAELAERIVPAPD
jgi:hypothetical protein